MRKVPKTWRVTRNAAPATDTTRNKTTANLSPLLLLLLPPPPPQDIICLKVRVLFYCMYIPTTVNRGLFIYIFPAICGVAIPKNRTNIIIVSWLFIMVVVVTRSGTAGPDWTISFYAPFLYRCTVWPYRPANFFPRVRQRLEFNPRRERRRSSIRSFCS